MERNVQSFFKSLVTAKILTHDELTSLENVAGSERSSITQVTAPLVKTGKLTKYQARCIEGGSGFLMLGPYVVLDEIGRGAMGVVLKARHSRMGRTVALKLINSHLGSDSQSRERFQREIRAIAQLEHPNTVRAYDAGIDQDVEYLVMEYIDGQDLAEVVREQGRLSVLQSLEYIVQAGMGLAYAHSMGIIHRDIKPSNILVDRNGTVKILDMGLSRLFTVSDATRNFPTEADLTVAGGFLGTPAYMAPEQALNSKTADHRSDIYSLGCTFHFLLCGTELYPGLSKLGQLFAHRNDKIPKLDSSREDIPKSLVAVFQKMVAKRPEDRYQSVVDAVHDLQEIHQTISPKQRGHRAGNRATRRTWITLVISSVLAVTVALAVLIEPTSKSNPRRPKSNSQKTESNSQNPKRNSQKTERPSPETVPHQATGNQATVNQPSTRKRVTDLLIAAGAFLQVVDSSNRKVEVRDAAKIAENKYRVVGIRITDDRQWDAIDAKPLSDLKDVSEIALSGSRVTDRSLQAIARFPSLKSLRLSGRNITGDGLGALNNLTNLKSLDLHGTKLSNAAVLHIAKFRQLEELSLAFTGIGDEELKYVAELDQLRKLQLQRTRLTDLGASLLGRLKNLEELHLDETSIDGSSFNSFASLSQLRFLSLGGTHVTDKALRYLADLPSLYTLNLGDTAITSSSYSVLQRMGKLQSLCLNATQINDDGLELLGTLEHLRFLHLRKTGVTPAGVAKIEKLLPSCRVSH